MKIRGKLIFLVMLLTVVMISGAFASLNVSLSDQGSGVKNASSDLLSIGDLEVTIWDNLTAGTLIYNETFASAITNGSWSVMLGENSSNNLSLEFSTKYYKDYKIAGEDADFVDFTGASVERQFFYSPLGDIDDAEIRDNTNITLGEKITFTLGETIDNILDGLVQVTGDFQATGGLTSLTGRLVLGGAASRINSTSPTANLTIATNNLERLRITNTGNIGIGTGIPTALLHVAGNVLVTENITGLRYLHINELNATTYKVPATTGLSFVNDTGETVLVIQEDGYITLNHSTSVVGELAVSDLLSTQSALVVGDLAIACDGDTAGAMVYNVTGFFGCNSTQWVRLDIQ